MFFENNNVIGCIIQKYIYFHCRTAILLACFVKNTISLMSLNNGLYSFETACK